jgi:membrane protein
LHLVKRRPEGPRREHEQPGGWWKEARALTVVLFHEMHRTRAWTVAAAIAFYYLLSLFPLLLVFSSALKFLPLPNLFQQLLNMMAMLVPPYAMQFVEQIVISILRPDRATLLLVGVVGYLGAASGGFLTLIEALNIAYDVPGRGWWKDRLRALLLAVTSGALVVISIVAYVVGPHFLHFLRETLQLPVPPGWAQLWPVHRMINTFVTFVTALEIIYYLGPNTKHRFLATLPGAVLAIAVWFVSSSILSFYLENMSSYNASYGSMGALIGLMAWFYLTGLAILLGAELNGERIKYRAQSAGPRASEAA